MRAAVSPTPRRALECGAWLRHPTARVAVPDRDNIVSAPLAAEGGEPVRRTPYPTDTAPNPADDADAVTVFERELARFVGGERIAITVATQADALALALGAAGLEGRAGLEVAVPALGGEALARAAFAAGLRPVPVDVDETSANIAARSLATAVGPSLRAVAVTHNFGHPANMSDLLRLTTHYGTPVIEDCTQSLGASFANTSTGALGAVAALGFTSHGVLTGGDHGAGGVVLVGSDQVEAVRRRRDELGAPLSEETARVAVAELRRADERLHARRQAAWHLTYELRDLRAVDVREHHRRLLRIRHGYGCYVVRLRSNLWDRSIEETVELLRAEGIPAQVASTGSLHEDGDVRSTMGDDQRLEPERFAIASRLARELVAIPLPAAATVRDMDDVAAAWRKLEAHCLRR